MFGATVTGAAYRSPAVGPGGVFDLVGLATGPYPEWSGVPGPYIGSGPNATGTVRSLYVSYLCQFSEYAPHYSSGGLALENQYSNDGRAPGDMWTGQDTQYYSSNSFRAFTRWSMPSPISAANVAPFDTNVHMFVVRLDFNAGPPAGVSSGIWSTATVWFDPDLKKTEPQQALAAQGNGPKLIQYFSLLKNGTNQVVCFDEIRLGTRWEDVMPISSSEFGTFLTLR